LFRKITDINYTMKKTLIIGASTNPQRYSFLVANRLVNHGYPIVMLGLKEGQVAGNQIQTGKPTLNDIDTVTLYIGPAHQPEWYEYVINLQPKRVIFNPGTENEEFEQLLKKEGIEALEACTLVLLSIGAY
jgi:predicted CoA-binding protein